MRQLKLIIAALLLMSPFAANAGLIQIGDRLTFESSGIISFNYGFEDWPANQFSTPGDPYYASGITYDSGDNLIVGAGAGAYNLLSTAITFNLWSPLTADIDAGFNMFGFDLSVGNASGNTDLVDILLFTNFNSYSLLGNAVPNGSLGSQFFGFMLTDGEMFTGFDLQTSGAPFFPAFDNATLGTATAVPEPGTLALLGIGLFAMGFSWRRKKV